MSILLISCAHAQIVSQPETPKVETIMTDQDLSTDAGVIAELQNIIDARSAALTIGDEKLEAKRKAASRLEAKDVCIKRLKESPKIIAIGFFTTDSGCRFDGAFINSRYFEKGDTAVLSKNAFDALGWEKANRRKREQLVKLWVEKGLLAFNTVLYEKVEDLNNFGFLPPQVVTVENGGIKITLWFQLPSGMSREKGFQNVEYRFAKDGNLTGGSTLYAVITQ